VLRAPVREEAGAAAPDRQLSSSLAPCRGSRGVRCRDPCGMLLGLVVGGRASPLASFPLSSGPEGLGGRDRAPGESLALWCQRRRRSWASFSFLNASFGSSDPLPTRLLKSLRVKT
jgi:hypothetical protein